MPETIYVKHANYTESNTDRFRQQGEFVECDADGNPLLDEEASG
jgi:hypothetical protein